jgi:lysylphosphatidylglycerol synthase-like protein
MRATKMRVSKNLLLAVTGIALWVWVIVHAGPSVVVHQLRALKVALPIVFALSLVRLLLQSLTWLAAIKSEGLEVRMSRLAAVRLASQGMGYLTVFGPLISEPMKINLLRTPVEATATATFLDNGVYWFTSALAGIAGCVSFSLMRAQASVSTLAFAAVFICMLFFIVTRKSFLSAAAVKLGGRAPSWLTRSAKVESAIREVRGQKPELVGYLFWLDVICQLLLILEVAVVLWSLRLPLHLLTLLAIEGLTRGVKIVTGFMPARLGADEGGAMSAFAASGFSPALGLTLALTRRIRDLLWALVGLGWLAWKSHVRKESDIFIAEGVLACKS